jgi:hypothetical protein
MLCTVKKNPGEKLYVRGPAQLIPAVKRSDVPGWYVPATTVPTSGQATTLTLIGPGEVKVDLADFDLKLRENL